MKGLRTMLFNAGVVALSAFIAMIDPSLIQEVVGSKYAWAVPMAIGGVNMILRKYTTTPVGKAE